MKRNQYFHLKMILYAVLVGLISGLGAVFYRWLLSRIAQASQAFLTVSSWKHLIIALIVMFVGAIIVNRLLKWAPLSGGSGIPQIKAELTDKVKANPWPTVTSKIVGGAINNFFGLSLGREGPSIQ
ncbi:MAG: chloride channel protein, partial [Aerococcus suis]|nr:chloride channel protein [Aerococcus suis]